jgi:hypothetical protein
MRMITRKQSRCPIEQWLVEIVPIGRGELAKAVCEASKLLCESLQVPVKGTCVTPGQCRCPEKRMISPSGMEAPVPR